MKKKSIIRSVLVFVWIIIWLYIAWQVCEYINRADEIEEVPYIDGIVSIELGQNDTIKIKWENSGKIRVLKPGDVISCDRGFEGRCDNRYLGKKNGKIAFKQTSGESNYHLFTQILLVKPYVFEKIPDKQIE